MFDDVLLDLSGHVDTILLSPELATLHLLSDRCLVILCFAVLPVPKQKLGEALCSANTAMAAGGKQPVANARIDVGGRKNVGLVQKRNDAQ